MTLAQRSYGCARSQMPLAPCAGLPVAHRIYPAGTTTLARSVGGQVRHGTLSTRCVPSPGMPLAACRILLRSLYRTVLLIPRRSYRSGSTVSSSPRKLHQNQPSTATPSPNPPGMGCLSPLASLLTESGSSERTVSQLHPQLVSCVALLPPPSPPQKNNNSGSLTAAARKTRA